ncbi:MAG: right-handed parallel beta-helix repeat-containing protein [Acidimicrobiia bacterium]|nr:right-handed parallel beta-helix repeat-containing protein [Acidimicrobiia bacterium]
MKEGTMQRTIHRRGVAVLAAFALLLAACGSDDDGDATDEGDTTTTTADGGEAATDEPVDLSSIEPTGTVISVPDDHDTIQGAVDEAVPGDLILVAPGVYNEAVDVTTDGLTIRGLDRNEVILDGEFDRDIAVRVLGANGVAVENMTARNYTRYGFYWTGVEGFRGSYLTSYRNGVYGIYAFDSTKGQFEHSYASGSADAGFYVGQCYPCDIVIDDVISEYNGLGYSGTNSGGELYLINSTWRNNRAGIVPNTGSYQLCYPNRQTTIVGNTVYSNQQPDTAAIDVALLAMGNGILLAGAVDNVVERNLVFDHERTGIGLVPFPEEDATDVPSDDPDDLAMTCEESLDRDLPDPDDIDDLVLWSPRDNSVRDNVVSDSGLADLGLGSLEDDLAVLRNCFADNDFTTSAPNDIETLAPCEGTGSGDWSEGVFDLIELMAAERPPSGDWETSPVPGPQPNMPDAEDAPARPANDVPTAVDIDAITVPTRP